MRTKALLIAVILLVFAGSHWAKGLLDRPARGISPPSQPQRIISLAPSVTETLFALGLGDRVVGVSRFCEYPPQVAEIPKIGGLLDPNFEAMLALRPELVVMLEEHRQSMPAIEKLGLPSLEVRHKDIEGILASIPTIGRTCGAEQKAARLVAELEARVRSVREKTAGLPRPRVLFVIERTPGSGRLEDVYVAGADGYFDKIITLAGGRNALSSDAARFPVISTESFLSLDPQVIVDMTPGLTGDRFDKRTILADWQQVGRVEAVAEGRVHAVDQGYAFVPGPRFILLLEQLARWIHPEVDWQ